MRYLNVELSYTVRLQVGDDDPYFTAAFVVDQGDAESSVICEAEDVLVSIFTSRQSAERNDDIAKLIFSDGDVVDVTDSVEDYQRKAGLRTDD